MVLVGPVGVAESFGNVVRMALVIFVEPEIVVDAAVKPAVPVDRASWVVTAVFRSNDCSSVAALKH